MEPGAVLYISGWAPGTDQRSAVLCSVILTAGAGKPG
jgi:hypothetical protein